MLFLTFHLAKDEPSKKESKRIDFLFNVSKTTFFECLNAVSVCISGGQYYCKCDLFSGCENYVDQINGTYCSYDFEQIKYQPVKLFKLASKLLKGIRSRYNFNKSLNFWGEDYE